MISSAALARRYIVALLTIGILAGSLFSSAMAAPPLPVVTTGQSVTSEASVTFDVDFGVPVIGFDTSGILVINGTASSLIDTGDGQTYQFEVTPILGGIFSVAILPASAFTSLLEPNLLSSTVAVLYDTIAPVPLLTANSTSPTASSDFTVEVNFGEVTTGLEVSDFVVQNATVVGLRDIDGSRYEVDLQVSNPTASAAVTIALPANAAVDEAGNANLLGNTVTVEFDAAAPLPLITTVATDPTPFSPVSFTLAFTETVSGFDQNLLAVSGGTVIEVDPIGPLMWTFDVVPEGDGEIVVSLPAGVVTDLAGNANLAAEARVTYAASALSIGDVQVDETAGTVEVEVMLSADLPGGITVDWVTADGSATASADYVSAGGTLSFSGDAGEVQRLVVPIVEDALIEGEETFRVLMSNPGNSQVRIDDASAEVIIVDRSRLQIEFANDTLSDPEDSGASLAPMVVFGAVLPVGEPVEILVTGGSATAGVDYSLDSPLTITVPAGDYTAGAILPLTGLTIVPDDRVEPDETIEFGLSSAFGNALIGDANADGSVTSTLVYTIENDDQLAIEFTAPEYADLESAGGSRPLVRASGGVLTDEQFIDVRLLPGSTSASIGADFTLASPTTVAVPAGDYRTPSTIELDVLTIIDDNIDEPAETVALELFNPGEDLQIGARAVTRYRIDNDDQAGVTFAQAGNQTGEDGTPAVFSAVLNSEPTGTVVLRFESNRPDEGSVTDTISFTPANWNSPQNVTVTGVDDSPPDADGTQTYSILTDVDDVLTDADEYAALTRNDLADLVFENQDDDAPSILVTIVDDDTDEAGTDSATLLFSLATRPNRPVTIPLFIDGSDQQEGSFSSSEAIWNTQATIAPEAWATGVAVSVFGIDDAVPTVDGDQQFRVRSGDVALGSDPAYLELDGGSIADPVLVNRDDDRVSVEFAAATSSAVEGSGVGGPTLRVSGAQLLFDESVSIVVSGGSALIGTDYLPDSPSIDVDVPAGDYTTAVDLAIADFIVLSDEIDEDDETVDLSIDELSSRLTAGAEQLHRHLIADDDTAALVLTPPDSDVTSETGTDIRFTVSLGSEPSDSVVLEIASDDEQEGVPDRAALTFTADDWSVPQSVVVTGVDDALADGTVSYRIDVGVADATSASEYLIVNESKTITLMNQDDDSASILVDVIDAQSSEDGDTAQVRFALSSRPAEGDVTIPLTIDESGEASIDVAEITIANEDWNDPAANSLLITGLDDETIDGSRSFRLLTGDPSSGNGAFDALTADAVVDPTLTNIDNDELSVAFSVENQDVSEDAGTVSPTVSVSGAIAPADLTLELSLTSAEQSGANAPADYGTSGIRTVTIPAGDYRTAVDLALPAVEIVDDLLVELDERINLSLQNPSAGLTLGGEAARAASTITLIDNDEAGLTVGTPPTELAENDTRTVSIALANKPASEVRVVLESDTPEHLGVVPGELVFDTDNWQTARPVTLSGIPDDDADEALARFSVQVSEDSDVLFRAVPSQTFELRVTESTQTQDSDGDGIDDAEECPTSPCRDTDGDGIPDFLDEDDDNDGISTRDEREVTLTDPLQTDSDNDGVPDDVEIEDGTPASNASDSSSALAYTDSDNDLVPDHVEVLDGTNPFDGSAFVDSDLGGLPDYIESTLFTNLGAPPTDPGNAFDDCRDLDEDDLPDRLELRIASDLLAVDSPTIDGGADTDGDMVSDAIEAYLSTLRLTDVDAATNFDRDAMPDAFEVRNCTNPVSAQDPDTDQDGVPDSVEAFIGQDIDNTTDSDGDSLPDVLEISMASGHTDADGPTLNGALDPDGNGISNAIESHLQLLGDVQNPTLSTDSDGDLISDVVEVQNFSDPFREFQPVAWIEVSQEGPASRISSARSSDGTVEAVALIGNVQAGDHEFDWSNSDSALLAVAGATDSARFSFDPSAVAPGVYTLEVRVRRSLTGTVSEWSIVSYPLEVVNDDSDVQFTDADSDGIIDSRDRSDGRLGRADEIQSVDRTDGYVLRSERGTKLQLGRLARTVQSAASYVNRADVEANGAAAGDGSLNDDGSRWMFPIGLHDFEIANLLEVGDSSLVVIPQIDSIPENTVYLKFVPGRGYVEFDTSGDDEVATAPGAPGVCPDADDPTWSEGLTAGHHCVRLTIADGGPNDADGERNGLIVDPGGVAVAIEDGVTPDPNVGEGGEPESRSQDRSRSRSRLQRIRTSDIGPDSAAEVARSAHPTRPGTTPCSCCWQCSPPPA